MPEPSLSTRITLYYPMGNTHVVPKAVGCVVPCFIQSLLCHSTRFSSVKLLPLQTAKYRAHLNPPSFPAKEPGRAEHGTQTQSLSQNCFKFSNLSLFSVWCHTKHSSLSFSQTMYIHCRTVHMYIVHVRSYNAQHTPYMWSPPNPYQVIWFTHIHGPPIIPGG